MAWFAAFLLGAAPTVSDSSSKAASRDSSEVVHRDDSTPYPTHDNTLAAELESRGITPEAIRLLRYVGDEHSHTAGMVYEERDRATIEWIWTRMFRTAEPYKFWEASGNRRVEIFVEGREVPAAILRVNGTDRTSIEGHDLGFMCRGFEALILRRLGVAASGTGVRDPEDPPE